MALNEKRYGYYQHLRDVRPMYVRFLEWMRRPQHSLIVYVFSILPLHFFPETKPFMDLFLLWGLLYFWWLKKRVRALPFKMPMDSPFPDPNNTGAGRSGKAEGILYLGNARGNDNTNEEIWFTNSDARTHILYLGTTGAGKTEGLKSMVTNSLTWGSGFVYIDGKADTDLWSSLSSLVRRFGRDDDLLVLNYMTGNSDKRAQSNTMNPFSSGSASYLTNMLVSLMPQAEGDNAMWKERAVSLISSLMPALTWKRDNQDIPLSVSSIREYLGLSNVIKLSRDEALPNELRESIRGYLDTLPGYVDDAFDEQGREKPLGPDQPAVDTTTVRQQHGYLTMQFTRSLQSLGDDYGYIFDTQAADVDMVDVVLNRRILVVLIPALEKSGDETANLGKIVAATLKGMMGSTLGATVEGDKASVIENKPTYSATPFMTVFDEVGYYTAEGMAVMAAQARSLGFCLIFSAQDLPALQKRVKEESRSITGNCNIKIFGKLSDPTDTKDYFERQAGKALVMQTTGFQLQGGISTGSFFDNNATSLTAADRADYGDLKKLREGQAVLIHEGTVIDVQIFHSNPGHAKATRVMRFLSLPPPEEQILKHRDQITLLRDRLVSKSWKAQSADVNTQPSETILALRDGYKYGKKHMATPLEAALCAVAELHARQYPAEASAALSSSRGESDKELAPVPPIRDVPPQIERAPLEDDKLFSQKGVFVSPSLSESTIPSAPLESALAVEETSPMGFFKKEPSMQENQQKASAPRREDSDVKPSGAVKKVSWKDLVESEKKLERRDVLSDKAENILEDASRKAADALFPKAENNNEQKTEG